jgi:hypothetical protein
MREYVGSLDRNLLLAKDGVCRGTLRQNLFGLLARQGAEEERSRVIAAFADTIKVLDFSFDGLCSGIFES